MGHIHERTNESCAELVRVLWGQRFDSWPGGRTKASANSLSPSIEDAAATATAVAAALNDGLEGRLLAPNVAPFWGDEPARVLENERTGICSGEIATFLKGIS